MNFSEPGSLREKRSWSRGGISEQQRPGVERCDSLCFEPSPRQRLQMRESSQVKSRVAHHQRSHSLARLGSESQSPEISARRVGDSVLLDEEFPGCGIAQDCKGQCSKLPIYDQYDRPRPGQDGGERPNQLIIESFSNTLSLGIPDEMIEVVSE